jgi:SAM-dependent methyltransferase
VRRDCRMTLVESRRKRASFLAAVIRELPLHGARLVDDRAERVRELDAAFDAVVARCAGPPRRIVEVVRPLLRPGGIVVISGPPHPRPDPESSWVTVPGVRKGVTRSFAVFHVERSTPSST